MMPFPNPMIGHNGGPSIDDAFVQRSYAEMSEADLSLPIAPDLLWHKLFSGSASHYLFDSNRGGNNALSTDTTSAQTTLSAPSAGRTRAPDGVKKSVVTMSQGASSLLLGFKRFRGVFDVVGYVGNGGTLAVPHALGSPPGMIWVKRPTANVGWRVYHRSLGAGNSLGMEPNAVIADTTFWNNTAPTSTTFTVGPNSSVNNSGSSHVAYVFGHSALASGMVHCGLYTGNGGLNNIALGFEPALLLIKRTNASSNWFLIPRVMSSGADVPGVIPNLAQASTDFGSGTVLYSSAGFSLNTSAATLNANGDTYIFMAIRKGRA